MQFTSNNETIEDDFLFIKMRNLPFWLAVKNLRQTGA